MELTLWLEVQVNHDGVQGVVSNFDKCSEEIHTGL